MELKIKEYSNEIKLVIGEYIEKLYSMNKELNILEYEYIFYYQKVCDWFFEEIDVIDFQYWQFTKYTIKDFIFIVGEPFFVISEKVFKIIENNTIIHSHLKFKPIKLRDKFTKEILDRSFYLVIPKRILQKNEKSSKYDLAYFVADFNWFNKSDIDFKRIVYRECGFFDEEYYWLNIYISDSLSNTFKKKKVSGIEYENKRTNQNNSETWYIDSSVNMKDRLLNWLKLLNDNILKSEKFKYLYFTIIEEKIGYYNLAVGGYSTKSFLDETATFDPNYCDLFGTELDGLDWKVALTTISECLRELYYSFDNLKKYQAFVGFHDSKIVKI